jgi:hypothetical protein
MTITKAQPRLRCAKCRRALDAADDSLELRLCARCYQVPSGNDINPYGDDEALMAALLFAVQHRSRTIAIAVFRELIRVTAHDTIERLVDAKLEEHLRRWDHQSTGCMS